MTICGTLKHWLKCKSIQILVSPLTLLCVEIYMIAKSARRYLLKFINHKKALLECCNSYHVVVIQIIRDTFPTFSDIIPPPQCDIFFIFDHRYIAQFTLNSKINMKESIFWSLLLLYKYNFFLLIVHVTQCRSPLRPSSDKRFWRAISRKKIKQYCDKQYFFLHVNWKSWFMVISADFEKQ